MGIKVSLLVLYYFEELKQTFSDPTVEFSSNCNVGPCSHVIDCHFYARSVNLIVILSIFFFFLG